MKHSILTALVFVVSMISVSFAASANTTTIPHPFFFTENKGQWDSRVLYKCNARNGMTWFLERDGVTLLTMVQDKTKAPIVDTMDRYLLETMRRHPVRYPMKSHALKFHFVKGFGTQYSGFDNQTPNPNPQTPEVLPQGELPWHNNYFLGNDSSKWAPDCRNYSTIVYRDVWDGIDVEWYEQNGKLEFDFVVQPGADASQIKVSCDGLTGDLTPTSNELKLPTSLGELRTALPSVYQITSGGYRSEVDALFEIVNKNEFGVTLPNGYQKEHALRIDPLVYSTYLGGISGDQGFGICGDSLGSAIVTGSTISPNFPVTTGAFDSSYSNGDCFVTKLNSIGSQLSYSTYLGGSGSDEGFSITPDRNGGVFVTGISNGTDFPTTNGAYQRTNHGSDDCFVTHLNSTGSQLIFSTLLGGSRVDWGIAVNSDRSGGVYITGVTASNDFPHTWPVNYHGGSDGFVAHFNNTGTQLLYSNYLGGTMDDYPSGIVCDSIGTCVVVGGTQSSDFPITRGAFDTISNASVKGFIVRMNFDGPSLLTYGTFLKGLADEDNVVNAVISDGNGGVIVTGQSGHSFPITPGAYDTTFRYGFIAHINRTLSQLIYSTYLDVVGEAITSDGSGGVVVTGQTDDVHFPTTHGAFDTTYNGGTVYGGDCIIARINSAGTQLLYGTFLGGSDAERSAGIVCDGNGGVIVTGITYSTNFPTNPAAYDTSFNGGGTYPFDCFITRLSFDTTNSVSERKFIPLGYTLNQNYPNPFNSSTIISYSLSKPGEVELKLFDLIGREIRTLVSQQQYPGFYRVRLDGIRLSSGEYFYRIKTNDFTKTQKMVLIK